VRPLRSGCWRGHLGAIPAVAVGETRGYCPATDVAKVRLWENKIGSTIDGNDTLWKCTNDTDLSNDDHESPGNCNVGAIDADSYLLSRGRR
jgi:hypothetical protein